MNFLFKFLIASALSVTVPLKVTKSVNQFGKDTRLVSASTSLSSVSVKNHRNLQYTADLYFGNPKQTMILTLDTDTPYTWVPSTKRTSHKSTHSFDHTKSSTFKNSSTPVSFSTNMGYIKGYLVSDSVSPGSIIAENQQFILVDYDTNFETMLSDGVLGLGFTLSDGISCFIDTLKAQNEIGKSVFSIYLSNYDNEYQGSIFTIGEFDASKYGNGHLSDIDVYAYDGYWSTIQDSFSVGSSVLSSENDFVYFGIAYSFITLPVDVYDKYVKIIENSHSGCIKDYGYLVCSCTFGNYKSFPDITFSFNGENFVIHAENYIYYQYNYCYLMIDSVQGYYYMIGEPFFREYYTVFDMDNKLIRVSPALRNGDYNYYSKIQQAGIAGVVFAMVGGLMLKLNRRGIADYSRLD